MPLAGTFRGSGRLTGAPMPQLPTLGSTQPGTIAVNFVNADVKDVVRILLGDTLHMNYVVEPSVQGAITMQSAKLLAEDEVLPALEMALRMNGVALVQQNDFIRVLPLQDATRQAGIGLSRGGSARREPGFAVEIVPLRFVAADEMMKILESISPTGSVVRADSAPNMLIVSGTSREIESTLNTISLFDVDALRGMSFSLLPLKMANAKALRSELETIWRETRGGMGTLRLIAIERSNSILAISPEPQYLDDVSVWVDRLDRGSISNDRQLFVYYVQNSKASALAASLSSIFTDEGSGAGIGALAQNAAQGLQQAGTLGGAQGGFRSPTGGTGLNTGGYASGGFMNPQGQGGLNSSFGNRANAGANAPGGDAGASLAPAGGASGNGLRISPDETNNALLIYATATEYQSIEAALKKLDIVPLQVLIQASVAEVTLTNNLRYGLQWFFRSGSSQFGVSQSTTGAVNAINPGFSYLLSSGDIRAVLSALEEITEVNVLSSPDVLVLNNQTASLLVGDQVPVATQSAVSVINPDAPIVNSIQFRDTGVILKVTPRVNSGGLVLLDVSQEVSAVAPTTTSTLNSPTIQQRRLSSSVAVQDGETVALGGLIRDTRNRGNSGIPALQDIPVLGSLFGTRTNDASRTELLILVTPRVVRSTVDANAVTEELRRKLGGVPQPSSFPPMRRPTVDKIR